MSISEEILKHLGKLPKSSQAEVLDFIEYLEVKAKKNGQQSDWDSFSLASAMAGMESEDSPYSEKDLKEVFR